MINSELTTATNNLGELRKLTGDRHTPPGEHYLHAMYLWDTCFHAIIYAQGGKPELAQTELRHLLSGQIQTPGKQEGLIANMLSFKEGKRLIDPEVWFRNHPERSDYSQPPVIALAVKRTYEALGEDTEEAKQFLQEAYPYLVRFYSYFRANRENKDSHLIGIIHPSETGRDSDPTFDDGMVRFGVNYTGIGPLVKAAGVINTALDYGGKVTKFDAHNRFHQWDPERIRKRFWVDDVMFNAIYVENLRLLADMADELQANVTATSSTESETIKKKYQTESKIFRRWALQTKTDMDELMKDNDGIYYALDKRSFMNRNGHKIKQLSVGNLFPLIFEDLDKGNLEKILNLLDDPNKFNTPFPIPSVPADDAKYDPHSIEKRLWRGPTWLNMNWYLTVEGLLKQAKIYHSSDPELSKHCMERARHIADKTLELVHNQGTWECYDPENGTGYRVHPFGWSNLGYILPSEVTKVETEFTEMSETPKL